MEGGGPRGDVHCVQGRGEAPSVLPKHPDPHGVAITNTHLWMVCWQVEITVRVTCLDGLPMCGCVFRPGSLYLGTPKNILWQCVTVVITVLAWWASKAPGVLHNPCWRLGPSRSTEELPGTGVRNLCY